MVAPAGVLSQIQKNGKLEWWLPESEGRGEMGSSIVGLVSVLQDEKTLEIHCTT